MIWGIIHVRSTNELRARVDGSGVSSNPQCKVQALIILEIPTLASTTNKLYSQKDLNSAIKCAKAISVATSWMHNTAETHNALRVLSHPITSSISWDAKHPWIKDQQLRPFFRKSREIHKPARFASVSGCVCVPGQISLISGVCSASGLLDQALYLKPPLACDIWAKHGWNLPGLHQRSCKYSTKPLWVKV